jgi:hypothetical protein
MKKIAAAFCLLLTSLTAHADHSGTLRVLKGPLVLKNQSGSPVELRNGSMTFKVDRPALMGSLIRNLKGERVLKISNGSTDSFEFRIPSSLIKSENEFSVHKDLTEQNLHLVATVAKTGMQSKTVVKDVACTYEVQTTVTVITTDSNGNATAQFEPRTEEEDGTENARVEEKQWTEVTTIKMYNEQSYAEIKSVPQQKNDEVILETFSECR